MGAITIAVALFGDLILLPAMLACFAADDKVGVEQNTDTQEPTAG
jgi:hypothetical protein